VNIVEQLQRQARAYPELPAIIDMPRGRERVTTFAALETATASGAALLRETGVVAGDTVLILQPMSAELYIAMLALLRMGGVAMFLDPSAGMAHIERCCAMLPPAALIASPRGQLLRLVSRGLRRIPRTFNLGGFFPGATSWRRGDDLPPHAEIEPCSADTPALITFTSGSTGLPKAAVRSHGFLLEQHRVLERALHLTPADVDLTTLPVFVLANLASAVTSLIPDADLRRPGSIDPEPVLRQISRHSPTRVVASPAFLDRLCDFCAVSGAVVPGFRHVFTGGAPVFADNLDRFAATFPGAEIVAVYGSTEAEPIAHISRQQLSAEDVNSMLSGGGLLTGAPVAEITARVIRTDWGTPLGELDGESFARLCPPAGRGGEIVVSGGHVLPGYLHGVGDEETKFRVDGTIWHRTGDCGYFDEQGRIWLLGRAAAVIHDDRGELHPFAVECAARQITAVKRTALLGRSGRRILFVERRKGMALDCGAVFQALGWARLDEVREIREIPLDRRHNAKVDYGRLAELV